ncbi:hypothetical protein [Clostridium arbusti]|uniref:hypothetical protein n=1 Tax=Clostridium arbusti TaxID=1137848 RepID=UPI00028A0B51|nr:hypothetical protein [Clostridium arbusti]
MIGVDKWLLLFSITTLTGGVLGGLIIGFEVVYRAFQDDFEEVYGLISSDLNVNNLTMLKKAS